MEGSDKQDQGITQRGVKELFSRLTEQKVKEQTRQTSVFVSFLQIYNEKVFDLLNPNTTASVAPLKK